MSVKQAKELVPVESVNYIEGKVRYDPESIADYCSAIDSEGPGEINRFREARDESQFKWSTVGGIKTLR